MSRCVVDAADYDAIAAELDANHGAISADTRWRLARKAFARVTAYDAAISNYLGTHSGDADESSLGETFNLSLEREQALRYGENPHQTGALYGHFLEIAHQLHGKELSFNNVVDISSAMNLMLEFEDERRAVVAILKHNTPCGVGIADTLKERMGQGVRDRSGLSLRRYHHHQSPVGHGVRARRK